jgi:ubiquinone/menaquinone biosynthesis C-methylase UbiE
MKNTERFSNRAENYVKYRPTYPKELIEYLYSVEGFLDDSKIADIGSGTGIFSRLLLERGSMVYGVEPNNEMRAQAQKQATEYERFTSVIGTAEETTLPDKSMDFVVCAQAFHWFDKIKCIKEFSRILKSGGKVALIWNERIVKDVGFLADYEEATKKFSIDYNKVDHKLITGDEFKSYFKDGLYNIVHFENEQLFDLEGLEGRMLSSSYSPLPGSQKYDELIKALKRMFDLYNVDGLIRFEYDTVAYIGQV